MDKSTKLTKQFIKLFNNRQFILYSVIGLTGVVLDYIIFIILSGVFNYNYLLSNFLAITIAIINNFVLNAYFNFKKNDRLILRFLLFYLTGFLGILLSQVLLVIFYSLNVNLAVSKLLTLPFVLVFQYSLNKNIAFGKYLQRVNE